MVKASNEPIPGGVAPIVFVLAPAPGADVQSVHTVEARWQTEEDGVPYAELVSRDDLLALIGQTAHHPELTSRLAEVLASSYPPDHAARDSQSLPTHGADDRMNICALRLAALSEQHSERSAKGAGGIRRCSGNV